MADFLGRVVAHDQLKDPVIEDLRPQFHPCDA